MAGDPGSPAFEEQFIEWYVWAHQSISLDAKRCRAAAWAAATSEGTQDDKVASAQKAAFGPEADDLARRPSKELRARAEKAAQAAAPQGRQGLRTCGIIVLVLGVGLLILGGVCFALSMSPSLAPR